jgi:hypothetical protein
MGMLDQAERMYRQAAEADPQNAIAVVGLARVTLEHGDDRGTWALAVQALGLDPENAAAIRLEARMAEILTTRGESVERPAWVVENQLRWRGRVGAELAEAAIGTPRPVAPVPVYPAYPGSGAARAAAADASPPPAPEPAPAAKPRGLLARLFGRG